MRLARMVSLFCALLAVACGGSGGEEAAPADGMPTAPPVPSTPPASAPTPAPPAPDTATFRITFRGTWTAADHPGDFPGGAHFSPPVGAVHRDADLVWAAGAIASDGVEQMAETGGTGTLRSEVAAFVAAGSALGEVLSSGIGATGTSITTITATDVHHLLSLVSMIAPSPDWFVGVRNLDLRPGRVWIDDLTTDLLTVYDSGTDSGPTFTSGNADVTPHDPIHTVESDGAHFQGDPPAIATLTIERIG